MASILASPFTSPSCMVTTVGVSAVAAVSGAAGIKAVDPAFVFASVIVLLFTPIVTAAVSLPAAEAEIAGVTPAQRVNESTDAISLFALIIFSFYIICIANLLPLAIIHDAMRIFCA